MARGNSTPDRRASEAKANVARVKRQYKVDLTKQRKLLPSEIPHVEDMVVVLKLAGYTRSQMAKVIGISRGQVTKILDKPEVNEKITKLRSALPEAALDLMQGFMIEAVMAIVDVMRKTPEDKLILQAAGEILDRGGIPKASRQERHQINEDKLDITDESGIVDRLREAPVEVQEEAAQIVERLELMLSEYAAAQAEGDDAQTE